MTYEYKDYTSQAINKKFDEILERLKAVRLYGKPLDVYNFRLLVTAAYILGKEDGLKDITVQFKDRFNYMISDFKPEPSKAVAYELFNDDLSVKNNKLAAKEFMCVECGETEFDKDLYCLNCGRRNYR